MHGKRIISALLALALCFAVTGCGGDVTPAASPSDSGQDGAEAVSYTHLSASSAKRSVSVTELALFESG